MTPPVPVSPRTDTRLKWAYTRILWLGAIILAMLAVGLILITALQPDGRRQILWFQISLALGINFLSGAVGAALFELLIRRPQERERQVASRSDVDAVSAVIAESIEQGARIAGRIDEIALFVQRHNEFDYMAKLDSLKKAEIADIFARRSRANAAMRDSLKLSGLTEVRIAGVTLGDFLGGKENSPWSVLHDYLRGYRTLPDGDGRLTVKILICDPQSLGARLFRAGRPGGNRKVSDLDDEVRHVVANLEHLADQLETRHGGRLSLEHRVCRVLPPCFILATDHTVYVQPYYLTQEAAHETAMPVLKYTAESDMRRALVRHFDLLWAYAGARSTEQVAGKPVRIDRGAAEIGLVEIFTDAAEGRAQMARLLDSASSRVWVQGVSNVPILESPLNTAFEQAAHRAGVDVRVMILDPMCEVAFRKTFRLYQKSGDPCAADGWEVYRRSCHDPGGPHRSSSTYRNIRRALEWFGRVAEAANKRGHAGKVTIRLVSTIDAFMMLADDRVLLEQYHYGDGTRTEFQTQTPLQLADDMPLLEFHLPDSHVFPSRRSEGANPVRVCESHLERVYTQFASPLPDEYRSA